MRLIQTLFLVLISLNVFGQVIPKPNIQNLGVDYLDLSKFNFYSVESTELENWIGFYFDSTVLPLVKEYSNTKDANYDIILDINESQINAEAYKLDIGKTETTIIGTNEGVFHGIQTLRQLITQGNGKLQCQTIIDSPAFKWRGMHLDVSRHFFDVAFIKKYIDMLALHKMNTFHWHLTDDQGWRIEIKKYPKLTQIGSQRKETIIGKNFNPYKGDGKPYGGFYTQEEIKEVVAYAAERYITVVPEIEMPGHAVAALSAYPQFSCREKPLEPLTKWGVSEDIYCSKDETFAFLFDILDEVLELFPSEYIHIGGDEAPKTRWKNCTHCQANIKKHKLKDEHELQSYFIGRVDSFLTSKGRKTIGWDEILEGGLAKNAAVMSWRGEKGGIAAAKQMHQVVMSPGSHCYFDHYQGDKKTEPLAIGGYSPLKKVYAYNPIPKALDEKYHDYILGAQGNVWTEYMETPEHVMYMALPRLCALSEVLWSGPGKNSYQDFTSRLIPHFDLLDTLGYNYSKALFNIESTTSMENQNLSIALKTDFPEYKIRYTTNGTWPDQESPIYKKTFDVKQSLMLHAAIFENGKLAGNVFKQYYYKNLATAKKIKLKPAPNEQYSTGGAQTLVNGIIGSLPWSGNDWLGWRGKTVEATLDLGNIEQVKRMRISFLEAKESWIHLPEKVVVLLQNGKNDYEELELKKWDDDFVLEGNLNRYLQEIKIRIIPSEKIPLGNPGAGQKPWLFCSEIIIE